MRISSTNGFVYLAVDGDGNTKVGCCMNVENRIRQLRIKCKDIKLVASISAVKHGYLEKMLHYALRDNHIKNEWFYGNVLEQVIDYVRSHGNAFGVSFIKIEPTKNWKSEALQ